MSTVITNGIAITHLNPKTGGGGGDVDIIDNLNSTRTDAALSAKQGKVLKGLVDQKMEKPADEGAEGQVLTLDENGNPVWDDAPSGVTIATEITQSSTNEEAAGAKAVYDFVTETVGDIETLLAAI